MKDRGDRCDLEAGMAKLYASESAQRVATAAMRLHGTAGQLTTLSLERHYRDTPLMIIGEGTNEIQRTLIARQLLERYGERPGALISRDAERDERRAMVLAVRQFVDKEIAPVVAEYEPDARYPADLVSRLAELGIFGALIPGALGGLDLDARTTAMIVEEIARGFATLAAIVTTHLAASSTIARFGTPTQRERLLPGMSRAEALGTVAFGADVTAEPAGDDWILSRSAPPDSWFRPESRAIARPASSSVARSRVFVWGRRSARSARVASRPRTSSSTAPGSGGNGDSAATAARATLPRRPRSTSPGSAPPRRPSGWRKRRSRRRSATRESARRSASRSASTRRSRSSSPTWRRRRRPLAC
jgi:hypothetical protein